MQLLGNRNQENLSFEFSFTFSIINIFWALATRKYCFEVQDFWNFIFSTLSKRTTKAMAVSYVTIIKAQICSSKINFSSIFELHVGGLTIGMHNQAIKQY